ncbi:hypothetical protein M5K25_011506 [Dendrobium thyrsiflorum]|uniref:Uncharacterized protein n=1 Tax=Dendrobium thyrsiflorum TaxID=117978 RepID=A0ABD0V2W9_DENTH
MEDSGFHLHTSMDNNIHNLIKCHEISPVQYISSNRVYLMWGSISHGRKPPWQATIKEKCRTDEREEESGSQACLVLIERDREGGAEACAKTSERDFGWASGSAGATGVGTWSRGKSGLLFGFVPRAGERGRPSSGPSFGQEEKATGASAPFGTREQGRRRKEEPCHLGLACEKCQRKGYVRRGSCLGSSDGSSRERLRLGTKRIEWSRKEELKLGTKLGIPTEDNNIAFRDGERNLSHRGRQKSVGLRKDPAGGL